MWKIISGGFWGRRISDCVLWSCNWMMCVCFLAAIKPHFWNLYFYKKEGCQLSCIASSVSSDLRSTVLYTFCGFQIFSTGLPSWERSHIPSPLAFFESMMFRFLPVKGGICFIVQLEGNHRWFSDSCGPTWHDSLEYVVFAGTLLGSHEIGARSVVMFNKFAPNQKASVDPEKLQPKWWLSIEACFYGIALKIQAYKNQHRFGKEKWIPFHLALQRWAHIECSSFLVLLTSVQDHVAIHWRWFVFAAWHRCL